MRVATATLGWTLCCTTASAQEESPSPEASEPEASEPEASEPEALPVIASPTIVNYVQAPFPAEALEQGIEGVVKLLLELDEAGEVVNIEVKEPAGHGFDEAAVDAVLQMTFTPARTEQGPVPVIFEFDYGFVFTPEEPEPEEALAPVNFEGLIREMGTRKPLEGVTVSIEGTEISAKTDDEGRFEVRGVPLGQQAVRLLNTGHVTGTHRLDFLEGEVTVVHLWLRSEADRENEVYRPRDAGAVAAGDHRGIDQLAIVKEEAAHAGSGEVHLAGLPGDLNRAGDIAGPPPDRPVLFARAAVGAVGMNAFLGNIGPRTIGRSQAPALASPMSRLKLDELIGGIAVVAIFGEIVIAVAPTVGPLLAGTRPVVNRVGNRIGAQRLRREAAQYEEDSGKEDDHR